MQCENVIDLQMQETQACRAEVINIQKLSARTSS